MAALFPLTIARLNNSICVQLLSAFFSNVDFKFRSKIYIKKRKLITCTNNTGNAAVPVACMWKHKFPR